MNPIAEEALAQGLSYADFRAQAEKNTDILDEVYAAPAYTAADLDFFRRLPPLHVVAIGENWCPDVFHTLPTWARLCEEVEGFSFHIFQRDQDPPLIDAFLYRSKSKRIPVYAFYDERLYLQTWWSGRCAVAEQAVLNWLAGRTFAELDDESRQEIGRKFGDAYRDEFRRRNFEEIQDQLQAFFHIPQEESQ